MGDRINGMGKRVLSLGILRERLTLGGNELGTAATNAQLVLTTMVATPPIGQ